MASGDRSHSNRCSGTPRLLAQRSKQALVMLDSARCTTPLCGPSQRSWWWSASFWETDPHSAISSSIPRPTSGATSISIARHTRSFPPPSVNARPVPLSRGLSVWSSVTAYAYVGSVWTASAPSPGWSLNRASRVRMERIVGMLCSMVTEVTMPAVELELPVLHVSLLGVDALEDRLAHKILSLHHSLGLCDDRFHSLRRNDYDAVAVGENVVAGVNRDGTDRDRLAEGVRDPPSDDVHRREVAAEDGEADLEDEVGVAAPAVDDVAAHAAELERLARQLAHVGERRVVRLADDDAPARRLREQPRPPQQRLVRVEAFLAVPAYGVNG